MDEDQLRARLRRLADVEPPVQVDRGDVLRAGRRRRRGRAAGAGATVLALALGAYPAVAALSPDPSPVPPAGPTPTASPAPRAVVDHEAGTITLPRDPLQPDDPELAILQTAYRHFFSVCMPARGFDAGWAFEGPVVEVEERGPSYGVWRAQDVLADGYAHVVADPAGRYLGDAESEAVGACEDDLVAAGLSPSSDDLVALRERYDVTGRGTALSTDEGRTLRDRWARCLAEEGVTLPPDDPESMIPQGVADAPLEEQVRVGLLDVACKERLDLVQRLADVDAALEAQERARTQEYRSALRRLDEAAVERSRQYLAEHGVTVPEPLEPEG